MSEEVKKTLLIVDDEQDIREIFSLIYESEFNILTADSGKTAFETYKKHNIDLILSDLKMPNGDGAFFAEAVKNYPEKKPCPFFIMTANLEYDYQELSQRGVRLVLAKPFDFDQFLTIANFFLNTLQKKGNSRNNPRIHCQLSLALQDLTSDAVKMLDISPEGFLLQFKEQVPLKAGDEIAFNSLKLEESSSTVVNGRAQCRWVIQHSEFILAGFYITTLTNRDCLLEFFNKNMLEGNFH